MDDAYSKERTVTDSAAFLTHRLYPMPQIKRGYSRLTVIGYHAYPTSATIYSLRCRISQSTAHRRDDHRRIHKNPCASMYHKEIRVGKRLRRNNIHHNHTDPGIKQLSSVTTNRDTGPVGNQQSSRRGNDGRYHSIASVAQNIAKGTPVDRECQVVTKLR